MHCQRVKPPLCITTYNVKTMNHIILHHVTVFVSDLVTLIYSRYCIDMTLKDFLPLNNTCLYQKILLGSMD